MSKNNIPLTSLVKTSGCAAKLGPGVLNRVLEKLPSFSSPNLMVGFENSDDACVYKINETTAAIQTVDFFPPMVDDPFTFGQIAAANALSDIYAMGANPAAAMNLLCFPACLSLEVMEEILQGGCSKVLEAGAVIAGGHTISDPTPKYGLSVTGFAHPDEILTNSSAEEGDVLVLTKPIGIGILNTAAKARMLTEIQLKEVSGIMAALNKYPKEVLTGLTVHACTDVTGFSLTGHSYEMAAGSKKTIEIYADQVPVLEKAQGFASMGIIPEGMYHNLDYLKDKVTFKDDLTQSLKDVFLDPQTSGGLLISLPQPDADAFLKRMEDYSPWCRIIGQVTEQKEAPVIIYK